MACLLLLSVCTLKAQSAASTINRIDQVIKDFETSYKRAGSFGVTVWDMKENLLLNKDAPPPYEVIVNGNFSRDRDCFDAKYSLFQIMRRLYTDKALKNKIARIKVTIPYQLSASLGSKDTKFDWSISGPTNFWRTLLEYKPYEDESRPLNQRTYGVKINRNCS